jgi:poly-gamma-glutamate capsule biosynthesis protein CapA/YwtB (metallophosphatase superfamily)
LSSQNLVLWQSDGSDHVAARVAIAGDFLPAGKLTFPPGRAWRDMADALVSYFEDVSTSFVNLESALDVEGLAPGTLSGIGQIVAAPAVALDYLDAIHSQAVGIANNHSYDFAAAGVERTRSAILHRGMIPLGAGKSLADSPEIFVWQGPGEIRVGFWAAARVTLDPSRDKSAGVEPATCTRARQVLAALEIQRAQVSIALIHAGCLRTNRLDPEDVRLMDELATCGFDIVAASHSHRISGHKQLVGSRGHPSFCFYGLGTLVSGYADSPLQREGLIVVAGLNRRGELIRLELRPLLLEESGFGSLPSTEMSLTILKRFRQLSGEIADGSFERLFYHDMSQGLLRLYLRDAKTAYRAAGLRGLVRKASRLRVRHVRRLVHRVVG